MIVDVCVIHYFHMVPLVTVSQEINNNLNNIMKKH